MKIRARFFISLLELVSPFYLNIICLKRKAWSLQSADLAQMPEGTLGKAIASFMSQHKLPWKPKAELHDVYHVLSDYPPTVKEEINMQFYLLGNGKHSAFVLGTVFLSWLFIPEWHLYYYRAIRRGQLHKPFHRWQFQHLLYEPLAELKDFIQNRRQNDHAFLYL